LNPTPAAAAALPAATPPAATLIVCPLSRVQTTLAARRPSHLITLLDPASLIDTPAGLPPHRHLRVGVNDIDAHEEGLVCPDETVVDRVLSFGADWDEAAPLLIHCWAGISRSTATAFVLACERSPDMPEAEIARRLRHASPTATPNRRIVALADDKLGRGGRMVDAVAGIGRGAFAMEGETFDLVLRG